MIQVEIVVVLELLCIAVGDDETHPERDHDAHCDEELSHHTQGTLEFYGGSLIDQQRTLYQKGTLTEFRNIDREDTTANTVDNSTNEDDFNVLNLHEDSANDQDGIGNEYALSSSVPGLQGNRVYLNRVDLRGDLIRMNQLHHRLCSML